jgi:tRNA1(Val) A37 N6-methylase TrmN6
MNCARTSDLPQALSDDAFLGGRLRLKQPVSGHHRAGHDAILLAAATPARSGDRVVEFGAGVGVAGLALARRVPGIVLSMVEIDPALANLAAINAAANGITAEILRLDVGTDARAFAEAGLGPDSVNVVLMNPPFNDPVRQNASPQAARRAAHVASETTLPTWVHAARRILKPGGTLTLIWRADGLADVLGELGRGFGGVSILPIHGQASMPAIRVLVSATKGGRAPLRLFEALLLNDAAGKPDSMAQAILAGDASLPLARR